MTDAEKKLREAAQLALDAMLLPPPTPSWLEEEIREFEDAQSRAIEALREVLK